jgi:CIC family chloride channel protein
MRADEAQKLFQPGRLKQIVLRDPKGGYAGIVSIGELHSSDIDADTPIETLAHQQKEFLLPSMTIREIMSAFEKSEADVLVVVDNSVDRTVIGTVSETHALRTYGEELERRNQEMFFR